ncbi:leucine-rich repeat-containing protein 40-like [Anopheles maculipalpis]|uniref:leucine-rich repeat-containing protein 40-like n=1 Tax=Anopheles maculipalpis TaxID=1496333 RepID=UPI0021596649|nr:leucine-rich repeat-containing protein 40-like [Anopheles maculipalpis]
MQFKAFYLWILSIWCQWKLHPCSGQCINRSAFFCRVDLIDMTTDGRIKLAKLVETEQILDVQKLIVAISPSGPFLTTMGNYFASITYINYREPSFLVPVGNTINEIELTRASNLRSFTAGPNTLLDTLKIEQSALDRLPPSLPRMTRLQTLIVKQGMLSVLRLDMLVENQQLTSLELSYNHIRQIFPITGRPNTTLSIVKLGLVGNQLERLDMSVFTAMSKLELLFLRENRLTHLQASIPITIGKLSTLDLTDNKLATLSLANLTLPNLATLSLGFNALKHMSSLPKTLPALRYLSLDCNNLTQLDLSYFRPYRNLSQLYVISNQIVTVRTSAPVRLAVAWLNLNNNRITSFNINGCDMPNITSLNLANNHLTVIPPVLERYPKLRLSMDGNPISCNTLLPYRNELQTSRLKKGQRTFTITCDTTSSFSVDNDIKVCCDG